MSIRTNVNDALNQVEANQLTQVRVNVETEDRINKIEALLDLFEKAITNHTDYIEANTADITQLYTNLDLAMQDIDAIAATPEA